MGLSVGLEVGDGVGFGEGGGVGGTTGDAVGVGAVIEQSLPIYPALHVQSQPSWRFWSVVTPFPLQSLPE